MTTEEATTPLVSMKELLEAGVHFGHQTRRWNPKMKPFIFGGRNGIYIIDLHQTVKRLEEASQFVRASVSSGGQLLFVGTKKQAQEAVQEAAANCTMPYINQRWLGGTLTNFRTIHTRVDRMKQLRQQSLDGHWDRLPKKESTKLRDELRRLENLLTGIEKMESIPTAMFIVDLQREHIAVREAKRLDIPIIAIVDTNCDPDEADFPIPGNDDAIRAIKLICDKLSQAAQEGRGVREQALVELAKRTEAALIEAAQPKVADEPLDGEIIEAFEVAPLVKTNGAPDTTATLPPDQPTAGE